MGNTNHTTNPAIPADEILVGAEALYEHWRNECIDTVEMVEWKRLPDKGLWYERALAAAQVMQRTRQPQSPSTIKPEQLEAGIAAAENEGLLNVTASQVLAIWKAMKFKEQSK